MSPPIAAQNSSPHTASLSITYDTEHLARVVKRSVAREVGEIADGRSRTAVDREGRTVTLEVRARDVTALRAALNTWFSLVEVAERTYEIGDRWRADDPTSA